MWNEAPAITTLDYSSQRPITLRSVHAKGEIFFLVTFPDEQPQETHKTWIWDAKEEVYREGRPGRRVRLQVEHVGQRRQPPPPGARAASWGHLVLESAPDEPLRLRGRQDASDLREARPDARKIQSPHHGTLYFERWGDEGKAPWEQKVYFEHKGDKLDQFAPRQPTGSRGDVRAKGVWSNGQWTIEFGRKLKTGPDDDVLFTPGAVYLFAVACYAMAIDTPHAEWSRPLYRTGDAFDRVLLRVASRNGR